MKPTIFETDLWLPRALEEVFTFFADAHNLQTITPEWLNFRIVTAGPINVRQGSLIDYRLRLRGFPMRWQSEITVWDPPHRFIDEQRRGPYRLWVHEHRFKSRNGGTQTFDRVTYAVPGGWLIDRLFVKRDVEGIFRFRQGKLLEFFDAR
jgi:ligand-binding SRPBCC domain-containing protein